MLKDQDPVAYENKLKELTLFMGEVFKDPDARRELFDFAKIEGNDNDVEYSMKKLFTENINPHNRQRSAIVSAFLRNAEHHRISGESEFNEQDLIDFINKNNIGILAPYLYDNFNPESITELTVSWWTEDKEIEELTKNPDWDGETPGFKIKLNDDGNFIQFRKTGASFFSNDLVYANDDYALNNPTVVFGSFNDDELIENPDDGWMGGGPSTPQPTVNYPHQIGVNCTNILNSDIIRWSMDNFRITGNTRGWPHPNRITIWVNSASHTTTDAFVNEKKIKRGETEWKTDFIPNNGVIATGWESSNHNQNIIIVVKRPTNNVDEIVITQTINAQGQIQNNPTFKITKESTYRCFNQSWFRCNELNGNYLIDNSHGFIDGISIWSYGVNRKGYQVQFTLAPKIIRL
jgi:hypothetical protein